MKYYIFAIPFIGQALSSSMDIRSGSIVMDLQPSGAPTVNVTFPLSHHVAGHRIHLGAYGQSHVDGREVNVSNLLVRGMNALDEFDFNINVQHHWVPTVDGSPNLLAVGPGSDLQRIYGSVDIIRDSASAENNLGLIYLGLSAETFKLGMCEPDSLITISTQTGAAVSSYIPTVTTRLRLEIEGRIRMFSVEAIIGHAESLLIFADAIYSRVFQGLPVQNSTDSSVVWLNNCTESRTRLPTIFLRVPSGEIRIVPEDYTRMAEGNVCEILIGRAPQHTLSAFTIKMNLLMLEGVNIRTTANEIHICDSAS